MRMCGNNLNFTVFCIFATHERRKGCSLLSQSTKYQQRRQRNILWHFNFASWAELFENSVRKNRITYVRDIYIYRFFLFFFSKLHWIFGVDPSQSQSPGMHDIPKTQSLLYYIWILLKMKWALGKGAVSTFSPVIALKIHFSTKFNRN